MPSLTEKQKQIFDFIDETVKKTGTAPTFRDISARFGFSSLGTVYSYIHALKKKGYLEESRYSALAVREKKEVRGDLLNLPIIGEIQQGKAPKMYNENLSCPVPRSFVLEEASAYLFLAKGEELRDELIAEGDFIVVQAGVVAEDGDTVFAYVDNVVYIRKFHRDGDLILLQSKKREAAPLFFKEEELQVQGIITALIRQY
ncbi:transcriptional repressor LexA [Estrella lausannensis]|uniref:LexA transcriptional repressor n=1 Tax=Estrella lausannensis TaxID=483423 RepID=A0A0H5DP82_9BACT|nr:transcriptional repressor LexA [Estrella lausannensis]CRX37738.1 LexA transcriptional repressor [Estrella lausannensis]